MRRKLASFVSVKESLKSQKGLMNNGALEKTDIFQSESADIKTCSGYHVKAPCLIAEPWDKAKNRRDIPPRPSRIQNFILFCF